MGRVLHVGTQDIQAVDFRGQGGRDRGVFLVAPFRDQLRRSGGIGFDDRGQPEIAQDAAYLAKGDGMGVGPF